MKLVTWNVNGRRNRTQQPIEALAAHAPGINPFQEVTAHSLPELRSELVARGLVNIVDGCTTVPLSDRLRNYRQLVASRLPVQLPQELNSCSQPAAQRPKPVTNDSMLR